MNKCNCNKEDNTLIDLLDKLPYSRDQYIYTNKCNHCSYSGKDFITQTDCNTIFNRRMQNKVAVLKYNSNYNHLTNSSIYVDAFKKQTVSNNKIRNCSKKPTFISVSKSNISGNTPFSLYYNPKLFYYKYRNIV